MAIRTATLLVALGATLATGPAQAAPRGPAPAFTFTDRAGDAAAGQAPVDVTAVTLRTTGGLTRGRYVPTAVVVSLRLAAAPVTTPGVSYPPGTVYARTASDAWMLLECGHPEPTVAGALVYVTPLRLNVSGSTLTWTVPLSALPGARTGTDFGALTARTEVTEPATGFLGSGYADSTGALDAAATDSVWHLG